MCVYSSSRNDVSEWLSGTGPIVAYTERRAFSDIAITDRHSDTTIFQLRAHWVRIFLMRMSVVYQPAEYLNSKLQSNVMKHFFFFFFFFIFKLTAVNEMEWNIVSCIIWSINPFKPIGFFHSYYLKKSILHFRGVRLIFFISLT